MSYPIKATALTSLKDKTVLEFSVENLPAEAHNNNNMPGNEAFYDAKLGQDKLKAVQALISSDLQHLNDLLADELSRVQEQNNWMLDARREVNELRHRLMEEENARREAEARIASLLQENAYLRSRLQQEQDLGISRRQPDMWTVKPGRAIQLAPRSSLARPFARRSVFGGRRI